jgi:hypothetical protein
MVKPPSTMIVWPQPNQRGHDLPGCAEAPKRGTLVQFGDLILLVELCDLGGYVAGSDRIDADSSPLRPLLG